MKLPKLSEDERFDSILRAMRLEKREPRDTSFTHVRGTFDISNSDRLGHTEVNLGYFKVKSLHEDLNPTPTYVNPTG